LDALSLRPVYCRTKEDLFFTAMVLPSAELDARFSIQPGDREVIDNLKSIGLQIVGYFREVMPIFLSLIAHPAFALSEIIVDRQSIDLEGAISNAI
jgi:hypothetical protein